MEIGNINFKKIEDLVYLLINYCVIVYIHMIKFYIIKNNK